MIETKPLFVGMNNPHSDDPQFDLYPWPPNSAGHRLWLMINEATGVSAAAYRHLVDRQNLVRGKKWSAASAKRNAREINVVDRTVVVLGRAVAKAMGLPDKMAPLTSVTIGRTTYWYFPHPSGRCRWYNDEGNYSATIQLLREIIDASGAQQRRGSNQRAAVNAR